MITLDELKSGAQKAFDHLKKEYSSLQTGRANIALVQDISVEVYGAPTPLKNVANISCPDAQTIKIEPWDKSQVGAIEKSINEADIGINPQNMGESIFLPIPPMTEERRKQLVKIVYSLEEQAKIALRNLRQDAKKFVKHQKDENEISEDQWHQKEDEIQAIVDQFNQQMEDTAKKKDKDIMSV